MTTATTNTNTTLMPASRIQLSVMSLLALVKLSTESGSRAHAEVKHLLGYVEASLSSLLNTAEQSKLELEGAASLLMLNTLLPYYTDNVCTSDVKDGVHMPPTNPIQASDVNV